MMYSGLAISRTYRQRANTRNTPTVSCAPVRSNSYKHNIRVFNLNTSMRPKPIILAEFTRGYKTEQVLEAYTVTALTYRGRPVNLRVVDNLTGKIQYPKTASANPAWIGRLAADLNKLYNTQDFAATTMEPKQ